MLIIAAFLAMITANTALQPYYDAVLHTYVAGLSISHWINDGLMVIFFLLVGLEVKRELIEGALNSKEKAIFPAIAALGGMLAPALVYLSFNSGNPIDAKGWAIASATDIAFAVGVISLLGKRVPLALKVFLLALAIIDDLGVIIIIALFYTTELSMSALVGALAACIGLFVLNRKHVTDMRWYVALGLILWFCVLKSGVHATLAGVILGFSIPLNGKLDPATQQVSASPLKKLEHIIHPYAAFIVLPIFAFANAGIPLDGVSLSSLTNPLPIGIALGLFIGKPLGIFTFSWVAVKAGIAKLPEFISMRQIFAVSVLCGIGFTMSIFISSLAFVGADATYLVYSRLGILLGSSAAAIIGYLMLHFSLPKLLNEKQEATQEKHNY